MNQLTETRHTAIETLAWLIHAAYEGDPKPSLLSNLGDVTALGDDTELERDRRAYA